MAVARLREALEPRTEVCRPLLRTVRGGYLLMVEPGELDADEFRAGVREGRAALDADDPERGHQCLASVALVVVVRRWRRRVRGLRPSRDPRARRVPSCCPGEPHRGRTATGAHAQVIGELQALLIQEPTRERLAAQLMLALYRWGRQAAALQVYQQTRRHLTTALGIHPGPALTALQLQILRQSRTRARPRKPSTEICNVALV